MSISPYTLNMLYQNNIIDSVPMDLAHSSPFGYVNETVQNPYLNSAISGKAFQNYGQPDSYTITANRNIAFNNSSIGVKNNPLNAILGLQGTGEKAVSNFYGSPNIGIKSNTAYNTFGFSSTGTKDANSEMNAWGISGNTQQKVGQVFSSVTSISVLKPLIGLGLLLVAGLSIKNMFKGSAKNVIQKSTQETSSKTNWKSKINPKNWNIFKKNKNA